MPISSERNTPEKSPVLLAYPVAANVKCWKGGLAVIEAGNATPGKVGASLISAGRFEQTVDNLGGAAGAQTVIVRRGCFQFANSASDAVATADIGKPCYVEDDQTVSKTSASNARSVAGIVRGVEPTGVWVEI